MQHEEHMQIDLRFAAVAALLLQVHEQGGEGRQTEGKFAYPLNLTCVFKVAIADAVVPVIKVLETAVLVR